jgi:hypothetical protein
LLWPRRSLATFGVDAVGQQVRRMGVPEIVEPEPRQRRLGDQPGPLLRNIDRLDDRAVGMGDHKIVVG